MRGNEKFYIHTFGCQMNENDSERMAGILKASGLEQTSSPEKSHIIIVNTCAVREKSEEKLFSLLGRLERIKRKNQALIGVTGCVAQLYRSKLWDRKPFIDFILGPDNYSQLPQILHLESEDRVVATRRKEVWQEIPYAQTLPDSRVSAYITIMEGCNNFCAYCVVPFTRGREKYRPLRLIVEEAEQLASRGVQEVQLLGQNVNSYVDPESAKTFSDLLKAVENVDGISWIRFITSHPKNFSDEIARTMESSTKICHQLHLPAQSGSTAVLRRMRRGYTRDEYLDTLKRLRERMPDISLSTDIIVGFPGETDKEFQETLTLLEELRFQNIFSFRYSPRPLTAASREKDDVPLDVKKTRLCEVQSLQKRIQLALNSSFIGQIQKVLCTGRSKKDPDVYAGRNEGYQVVNFRSLRNVEGEFVNVRITSCGAFSLFGEAI